MTTLLRPVRWDSKQDQKRKEKLFWRLRNNLHDAGLAANGLIYYRFFYRDRPSTAGGTLNEAYHQRNTQPCRQLLVFARTLYRGIFYVSTDANFDAMLPVMPPDQGLVEANKEDRQVWNEFVPEIRQLVINYMNDPRETHTLPPWAVAVMDSWNAAPGPVIPPPVPPPPVPPPPPPPVVVPEIERRRMKFDIFLDVVRTIPGANTATNGEVVYYRWYDPQNTAAFNLYPKTILPSNQFIREYLMFIRDIYKDTFYYNTKDDFDFDTILTEGEDRPDQIKQDEPSEKLVLDNCSQYFDDLAKAYMADEPPTVLAYLHAPPAGGPDGGAAGGSGIGRGGGAGGGGLPPAPTGLT